VAATCGRWGSAPAELGRWLTGVVRCNPIVCGPDVAPMWPQRSRAWKARPVPSSWPDAPPMPQVRPTCDGPLLTVRDHQMPVLRARPAGTNLAQAWRRWLPSSGDRRGPSPDDHSARWLARRR
jgi:hypothetical protein